MILSHDYKNYEGMYLTFTTAKHIKGIIITLIINENRLHGGKLRQALYYKKMDKILKE